MTALSRSGSSSGSPARPLGLLTVTVWLAWAWLGGGHSPTRWGLLGLSLVLLLALGLAVVPVRPDRRRGRRLVVLACLAAFVGWNFLSILWADFPGQAWIGADKALLYTVVFALFALWPWTRGELVGVLALFSLGLTVIGTIVLARAALVSDPSTYFIGNRLASPIGYVDGTAALWMLGFWPAVYLSHCRLLPPPARALFLASAALLVDLAILGQSRGWLFVTPVVGALFLLLARERLRSLLGLALVAAATLPILRPLLDVYERTQDGTPIEVPLDRAARDVLVSCALVGLAGLVWAFADRRVKVPPRAARTIAIVLAVATVGAAVSGGAVAAATVDHPRSWLSARWHEFTCPYCPSEKGGSRFTGTLSNDRYQDWKVAWQEFRAHPVAGLGSDNYAAAYLRLRPTPLFQPRYPHSTPLRLLSELGLVGTALFTVPIVLALGFALQRRRRLDATAGGAVGAALSVCAYWLLHGSIDWFWEIPALAAPAFGLLALAGAVEQETPEPWQPRRRRRPAVLAAAGAGAVVLVAACGALALQWLAATYEDAGAAVAQNRPSEAYSRLERAAELDPLSAQPLVVEASIAIKRRDGERGRTALRRALEREPDNWYAHLQLGLLDGLQGRFRPAAAEVRRARELNPRDPGAALVERLLRRRAHVQPELVNSFYLSETRRRFG